MDIVEKYGKFFEVEGTLADDLRFLAPAISTTDFFSMDYLVLEDSTPAEDGTPQLRAIATDRARMHIVDPLPKTAIQIYGLKAGKYRVLKVNRNNVQLVEYPGAQGTFPDYKRAIPTDPPKWTREFYGEPERCIKGFSINLAKISNIEGKVCAIDFNFLKPLAGYSWSVGIYDSDLPWISKVLVFKSGTKTAYLMPLNAD